MIHECRMLCPVIERLFKSYKMTCKVSNQLQDVTHESYTPIRNTRVVTLFSVPHIHFSAGANKEAEGVSGNLAAKQM